MSKNLEEVVDWISTTSLVTDWDKIAGAGWTWKNPEWDGDHEGTKKYRYDFEFEEGTPINQIIAGTRLGLSVDVPFTFEGVDNSEIVSAFLYAEHAHKRTHPKTKDHPMDEVTVFLRYKGLE